MARIPAEDMIERARAWAATDERVWALVVYGSVARGRADAHSDLDLLVVTAPGERDALWAERGSVVDRILGGEHVYAQELSWQRPYRFGAYRADLVQVDLTMDEGRAEPWSALLEGFTTIFDRAEVESRLRAELDQWRPPEYDAEAVNGPTWTWLKYLGSRIRRGQAWIVRSGVQAVLETRVLPLWGVATNAVETALGPDDHAALTAALPTSNDAAELKRAVRVCAELYESALTRWAERTGRPRPENPLAPAIRRYLDAL